MTLRYYMVTFDIIGSRGREGDYRKVEEALKFRFGAGNYWKLVKQCAVVRTFHTASDIRGTLAQQLGRNCNILVVRLRHGYAVSIRDSAKRAEAIDCLRRIPAG